MVARRILVPPVRVRILPRQLLKIAVSWLPADCNFLLPYLHNIAQQNLILYLILTRT